MGPHEKAMHDLGDKIASTLVCQEKKKRKKEIEIILQTSSIQRINILSALRLPNQQKCHVFLGVVMGLLLTMKKMAWMTKFFRPLAFLL